MREEAVKKFILSKGEYHCFPKDRLVPFRNHLLRNNKHFGRACARCDIVWRPRRNSKSVMI